MIHVSLVEKVGHPQALIGTMIGNQHGVSFSREVGLSAGSEDDEEEDSALEGSQVRGKTITIHVRATVGLGRVRGFCGMYPFFFHEHP